MLCKPGNTNHPFQFHSKSQFKHAFAPGQEECEQACEELAEASRSLHSKKRHSDGSTLQKLLPVSLYAALPAALQLKAFDPPPRGFRKVRHGYNLRPCQHSALYGCFLKHDGIRAAGTLETHILPADSGRC